MSITLAEIKVDRHTISLSKLTGKKIKDIHGYLTKEFGDPVFEMTKVVFEDDTEMGCEGEHDLPYLVTFASDTQPNCDEETLEELYREMDRDD